MSAGVTIWIDADAAPGDVKEVIFRAAKRLAVPTVLVANSPLTLPAGNPNLSAVCVEGGANVADRYIAEQSRSGDLAITADIPLASVLVRKGVTTIDPRGIEHTPDNIGSRLASRDLLDELRGAGSITGGPRPFQSKDKAAFAATFDRALTRVLRTAARKPAADSAAPPPSSG